MDHVPKESQEIDVEFIVVTHNVSSSGEPLEFFVMVHPSVSSFSECLEFFPELFQIFVDSSDITLAGLMYVLLRNSFISFSYL